MFVRCISVLGPGGELNVLMSCVVGRTDAACHCVFFRQAANGTSIDGTSGIEGEDVDDFLDLDAGEEDEDED